MSTTDKIIDADKSKPNLKLVLNPSGEYWLHVNAPSGLKALINIRQRDKAGIVGKALREVAELHEDKTATS